MSRLQRLIRILACRTGLRTGKSVGTSGNLPLTKEGTFGGFPLLDYGVYGAVPSVGTPTPARPVFPSFVGEARFPGNVTGLSLVISTEDPAGNTDSRTVSFPGVEPLRAISGVSDELDFRTGKLIRRVGVCHDPVPYPGLADSYGSGYPSVRFAVGDGTSLDDHPHLLSTHWKDRRASDLAEGSSAGMAVKNGLLYVNLSRALYRRYVTGCVGKTAVTATLLTPSTSPGEFRCDFYDGTSRVFTLTEALDGVSGCRDVLAVSRSGAILKKNLIRRVITGTDGFTALPDYESTGETLFRAARTAWGAKGDVGTRSLCTHFTRANMTPTRMLQTYTDAPAFCEDGDYWYFHVPGQTGITGFGDFLTGKAGSGAPVVLIYPAAAPSETALTSYLADTATVGSVTVLGKITDNDAFDQEDTLTLVPAMREFLAEEREEGREVLIYYALPDADVTETDLPLPSLSAGEGATTFSVVSAQAGGLDPVTGRFTAFCEE